MKGSYTGKFNSSLLFLLNLLFYFILFSPSPVFAVGYVHVGTQVAGGEESGLCMTYPYATNGFIITTETQWEDLLFWLEEDDEGDNNCQFNQYPYDDQGYLLDDEPCIGYDGTEYYYLPIHIEKWAIASQGNWYPTTYTKENPPYCTNCTFQLNSFVADKTTFDPMSTSVTFTASASGGYWDQYRYEYSIKKSLPDGTCCGDTVYWTWNYGNIHTDVVKVWDGRDSAGNIVEYGTYYAEFRAEESTTGACKRMKRVAVEVQNSDCVDEDGDGYYAINENCPESNDCDDTPGSGFYINPGYPERCDGIDHDCSGNAYNGFDLTQTCSAGEGVCEQKGVMTCTSDGSGTECSAEPDWVQKTEEICDNEDNNCNSEIDEGDVCDDCLKKDTQSTTNIANGNQSHEQPLFAVPGRLAAEVSLYYNSIISDTVPLGRGWSHSYAYSVEELEDGQVVFREGNGVRRAYDFSGGVYVPQKGDTSTLVKNADNSFTITELDGTTFNFYTSGKVENISDRYSNTVSFAYNSTFGNLSSVTDPVGRVVSFESYSTGLVTRITDPAGSNYIFTYTDGLLTSVTNPDGGQWIYTYDADGYMLTKTDPEGNMSTYAYDAEHRVISTLGPDASTKSLNYDSQTTTTQFTESDGGVWDYIYDSVVGNLISKTDPLGGVTTYSYDTFGNMSTLTDADGNTSFYDYDSNGNLLSYTDPEGTETVYTYNSSGQTLTETVDGTFVTTYTYDAFGNFSTLTNPAGEITRYDFDALGNVTRITDALGNNILISYDAWNNLESITLPDGLTATSSYDVMGRLVSRTEPSGTTTFDYDSMGRLLKVTDSLGNETTYTYDKNGNMLTMTDANGNVTTYEYNYRGRVTKITDALGNVTQMSYGSTGCGSCGGEKQKMTSLTDAKNKVTNFAYDTLGRLTSKTLPEGTSTSYGYSPGGRVTSTTDARGITITYSYDGAGRLIQKTYPDDSTENYTYDSRGNLQTATNANISYSFTRDAVGRVTQVTDSQGRTIDYGYDAAGRRTTMTPQGLSAISYVYDTGGRLTNMTAGGDSYVFGYDAAGRRNSLTYPNGVTTTYSYDTLGRLKGINSVNTLSESIVFRGYSAFDKVGNRKKVITEDKTIDYSYDEIYRMTEALHDTGSAIQNENYTYDEIGNRQTIDNDLLNNFGPGDAPVTVNGVDYRYDDNGILTPVLLKAGEITYGYDYENRLSTVTRVEGGVITVVEYKYDPFGRRIERKVTVDSVVTKTTRYRYDGTNVIAEYNGTDTLVREFVHGPGFDELLSVTISGVGIYYYHADALGSVINLSDASGTKVEGYGYDSFGNLISDNFGGSYTYTGREWDAEAGLYYYRARFYDPETGRFISKDPIGFAGGDVNLYSYVGQNPVNFRDPSGNLSLDLAYYKRLGGEISFGTKECCRGTKRKKINYFQVCGGFGHGKKFFGKTSPGSITMFGFSVNDECKRSGQWTVARSGTVGPVSANVEGSYNYFNAEVNVGAGAGLLFVPLKLCKFFIIDESQIKDAECKCKK